VLYAGFGLLESRLRAPLLDPRLLTRRPVLAGTSLMLLATALLISCFFLGSFYFQHIAGHGPLLTGMLFLPVALGTIAGAHLAAGAVGRLGPRPVAAAALSLTAAALAGPAAWPGTAMLTIGIRRRPGWAPCSSRRPPPRCPGPRTTRPG
jgi:hypothetical protein